MQQNQHQWVTVNGRAVGSGMPGVAIASPLYIHWILQLKNFYNPCTAYIV